MTSSDLAGEVMETAVMKAVQEFYEECVIRDCAGSPFSMPAYYL